MFQLLDQHGLIETLLIVLSVLTVYVDRSKTSS